MFRLSRNQLIVSFFLLAVSILLSARIFYLVDQYAPTIYFWDRWHTMEPAFYNLGFWESVSYQHGQHRLGLIAYIFKINAWLSNFNGRADMFLQAGIYVLSVVLALNLKLRLFHKLSVSDLIIPLIFLTPAATETFTGSPFVHGLIPFMAILLCHLYMLKSTLWKNLLIALTLVVSAFTGFVLVLIPAVLVVEFFFLIGRPRESRWGHLVLILLSAASLLYVYGSNKQFESMGAYSLEVLATLKYAVILLGDLFIVSTTFKDVLVASLTVLGAVALAGALLKRDKWKVTSHLWISIIILLGGSMVFCVLNILGRGHMDIANALADRYIPVGMSLALGVYFLLLKYNRKVVTYGGSLILILLLIRVHVNSSGPINKVKERYEAVKEWEDCLRQNELYLECEEKVVNKNALHPNPEWTDMQGKLDFLRENNLNIYSD